MSPRARRAHSLSLYADLGGWHTVSGGAFDDKLVFPGRDEEPWTRTQVNNWRARIWRPVLESLATEKWLEHLASAVASPYGCRGSFVSLHLRADASLLEVAAWAGHSTQVMFSHHTNAIEELASEPRIPVEEQIKRARDRSLKTRHPNNWTTSPRSYSRGLRCSRRDERGQPSASTTPVPSRRRSVTLAPYDRTCVRTSPQPWIGLESRLCGP